MLAEMFAVGLMASFCINVGCLLIYRNAMGSTEIEHHTSRLGTLILWIILISCFRFLVVVKIYGTMMWAAITDLVLIAGLLISQRHNQEAEEIAKGDSTADMIAYLEQSRARTIHFFFLPGWRANTCRMKRPQA